MRHRFRISRCALLAAALLLVPARNGHAAFPGGNGLIAFEECFDVIKTVNPDGSGLATLFPARATTPAWSPDGKKIAYGWTPTNAWYQVRVAAADGSGATVVIENATEPDWSPDGTKIVYRTPTWTLGMKDLTNGGTTPLTTLVDEYDHYENAAWDPSGGRIAFMRSLGFGLDSQIWIIDADGTNLRQLTTPPAGRRDVNPEWSPDGATIVFERKANWPNPDQLFLVDPDGGAPTPLTTTAGSARMPAWSPDGDAIAYLRVNPATGDELWVTTPAGGDGELKLPIGCVYSQPTWQPLAGTFVVNAQDDWRDVAPGDGVCDTGHDLPSGKPACTLAAAVDEANAAPDANRIVFAMPNAVVVGPAGVLDLTAPVTIDGTTQPGADRVALMGNIVLRVSAAGCTLRGLRIIGDTHTDTPALTLHGDGTVLEGSYVGTDGSVAMGPGGILIASAGNRIGGPDHDPGVCNRQCNVISGNSRWGYGIQMTGAAASDNRIEGNFVGPNAGGNATPSDDYEHLGTQAVGIEVRAGASDNLIGGATPGAGNVIAGNTDAGVLIEGGSGNRVQGNRIGTNAAGSALLPQQQIGVRILDSHDNEVRDNLVSGHGVSGLGLAAVQVAGAGSSGNAIRGNLIGSAIDGTTALPNFHGVEIEDGAATTTIDGNVLAFNAIGVVVIGSPGTTITANDIHDGDVGIRLDIGTTDSLVAENTIHANGAGVAVLGDAVDGAVRNRLSANAIYDNDAAGGSGLAIDLAPDGPTANDVGDADAGPNDLQNFPTLAWAVVDASGSLAVRGALATALGVRAYAIELFASPRCDASGHGEAARFLGTAMVATDLAGTALLDTTFAAAGVAAGESVSATATDEHGNTSELSRCAAVEFGTAITAGAPAGAKTLTVDATTGFAVGDRVTVCPGCPTEEANVVAGFGSLVLAAPLAFDHAAGEPVVRAATTLDAFTAWTTAVTKRTTKPAPRTPVTLADRFGGAAYDVGKLAPFEAPAAVNGAAVLDAATDLEGWAVKRAKGESRFAKRRDVRVVTACSDTFLQVKKPIGLLVPAASSLAGPVAVPDPAGHERDALLCYAAAAEKKRRDGTVVPSLPKGTQLEVADRFQARRYDLVKITRICQPAALDGTAARHPFDHLVCYQAKLATKFIAQAGCGPAEPADKGTKIVPKQAPHVATHGLHVASELAALQLDTKKAVEVCLPATSPDAGVGEK